ncbi:DNA-processing protein DprA [Aquifex aeolicus]|uniref:Smf/DprA SLOG domain-containing protein n=1 Tax=Aquifex aeolicus (strain VF5) TaxID=224324 RepID=O67250_AQUAE|nr:DNA-processing protein DprA [Aquifex aeolicus]AAC07224.1 hypothetical protein aq_1191 [Aquifex aeolicus VF5]
MTNLRKLEDLVLYVRLADTNGVGLKSVKKILYHFKSIRNLNEKELERLLGTKRAERVVLSLETERNFEEKLINIIDKNDIKFILYEDKEYPEILKGIDEPPPYLFYQGEPPEGGYGIVGTRRPSKLSLNAVEKLLESIEGPIISGGAVGIDFKAHFESLKHGFKNFVILGTGILKIESRIKKLKGMGASLVSEFLPWTEGSKWTFPKRNRIIAGLSKKLFVMEAGSKSGALITADYAHRYGREIYAYVGDEHSERWKGCLKLIEEGKAKRLDFSSEKDKLLEFLSVPRTFDEVISFLKRERKEVFKILSSLIIQGKVVQEGAYYKKL